MGLGVFVLFICPFRQMLV